MKRASTVLAVILITAAPIVADEGRIPIIGQTAITEPGVYMLTRDISVVSGVAITIMASNVVLDLNDHQIDHQSSTDTVIAIIDGATDITIRDGKISRGGNGIGHTSTGVPLRVRIERVQILGSGVSGITLSDVEHVEVIGCRVSGTANGGGININAVPNAMAGGRISGNNVSGTHTYGLRVSNPRALEVRGNSFTDCATGTSNPSIWLATGGSDNVISGNTVSGGGGAGIEVSSGLSSSVLRANLVADSAGDGIVVSSPDCILSRNVSNHNGGQGYLVSVDGTRCRISNNHAIGNGGDGLLLMGIESLVESNVFEGNDAWGVNFNGSGHAYRDNMLRGNKSGAVNNAFIATDAGGNIQ